MIIATAILHNFAKLNDEVDPPEAEEFLQMHGGDVQAEQFGNDDANDAYRQRIVDNFFS